MDPRWRPIALEELQAEIRNSEARLSAAEGQFWNTIKIDPEKWSCPPHGDEGGGFWVVGIFGRCVLWYNDIEDGFNRSRYSKYGRIETYVCDQSDLRDAIRSALDSLDSAARESGQFGPPEPIS